ncbi:SRPBCC domain-containing protein [Pelagibacterium sp.]|uniref:SRPBCC domain-containing protein n=1 Tax=Pelagibacterium sp. TaxID=1967288 RepID=UPI003BAD4BE4
MSDTTVIDLPSDKPIITFTRTFKAPRALVWKAYTERDHVARWWGPRSIGPVEIVEHDFRPGGRWRYVQDVREAGKVSFFGRFVEIDAPESYVNTFGFESPFASTDGKEGRETQRFEDMGETTRYIGTSYFDDFASRDAVAASGMESGAREQIEQFANYVLELGQ